MLDTVAGLPVHVLVVHAVVVLGPLAGLAAVLYAVRPAWRVVLRWPLLVLAVVAAVTAVVAAASGEELEARLRGLGIGGATLEAIQVHAGRGELTRNIALVFAVLVVAVVGWLLRPTGDRAPTRGGPLVATVTAAAVAVAGAGLVVSTVLTGHSGSSAVWSEIATATRPS